MKNILKTVLSICFVAVICFGLGACNMPIKESKKDLVITTLNTDVLVSNESETYTQGEKVLSKNLNITITATPNEGYTLTTLIVNGEIFTNGETVNVKSNVEIIAISEINTYTINSSSENGTVRVLNNDNLPVLALTHGETYTISATANTGYYVSAITINEQIINNLSSFTAIENVNIVVNYEFNTYTPTIISNNSSLVINNSDLESVSTLTYGQTYTFRAIPDTGYEINNIIINGTSINNNETFTFTGNIDVVNIKINTILKTYTTTINTSNSSVKIYNSNSQEVTNLTHGETYTISATANTGCEIRTITLNSTIVSNNSTFVASENVVIEVLSYLQTYNLTTSGENITYTITRNSHTVTTGIDVISYGDIITIIATPNSDYVLNILTVNGTSFTSGQNYVVLGNVSIAGITLEKFNLTTSGENITYTITRNSQTVTTGTDVLIFGDILTINATVSTGYNLSNLNVNGVSFTNGNTITVNDNITIVGTVSLQTYNLSTSGSNIIYSITKNGTAINLGNNTISYGDILTVIATPNIGYALKTLTINGTSFTSGQNYVVLGNVSIAGTTVSEHTITNNIPFTYMLVKINGISPTGGAEIINVLFGDVVEIDVSSDYMYTVKSRYMNGEPFTGVINCTITEDIVLTGTAEGFPYNLTTSGDNITYTITRNSQTVTPGTYAVNYGDILTITATPNSGYDLNTLTVNGTSFTNGNTITVIGDVSIAGTVIDLLFLTNFGENDWNTISQISELIASENMTESEVFSNYGWNIGDTKTETLTTGETITLRIIGFNHDTLSSDHTTKAGITMQMVDCLATRYLMNTSNKNAGGWGASVIRTSTLPTIKATLPSELQSVIKLVDKKAANGGSSNYSATETYSDDLFLLAEIEIFGTISYAQDGANEGTQYAYWAEHNTNADRKKNFDADANGEPETVTIWWERSSSSSYTSIFCSVYSDGCANCNMATNSYGLAFGFCI